MATDYSGWTEQDSENYMGAFANAPGSLSGFDRAETNRFNTYRSLRPSTRPRGPTFANGFGGRNNVGSQYRVDGGGDDELLGDPLTDALGPGASRSEVEEYVRNNYGYFAAFMDVPGVGTALYNAAIEGWSPGKLKGAIYATDWWQSTSAAQRTWQQLVGEDPAEARRLAAQTAASVTNRAKSLGLPISGAQIASIAGMATANGWTDEQRIDYLIGQVNWGTLQGGDLTAMRDDVKAIGGEYLVGVSQQTAQNYAMRIASGELTQEGVASIMRGQAKARFGYLSEEIDQGISVKDYFLPIRDTIANELGMAPEAVDMMDNRWLGMMESKGDDGKVRASTINEAMLSARQQPEFTKTQKAQEMTTQLSGVIADMFGRRGI